MRRTGSGKDLGHRAPPARSPSRGGRDDPGRRGPAPAGRQLGGLPADRALLRVRPRHRDPRPTLGLEQHRLLPVRAVAARLGHRPRVRLRQPRRGRDHRDVGQRRQLRHRDHALLLGRRRAGDAVPRRGDDAVLLRLPGAVGPRVHEPPVRTGGTPGQRDQLRRRPAADRRHQPVPARQRRRGAARLAAVGVAGGGGGDRADLHRPRRPVRGHLQRGPPVLRHRRGAAAADAGRPSQGRWVGRPEGGGLGLLGRSGAALVVAGQPP